MSVLYFNVVCPLVYSRTLNSTNLLSGGRHEMDQGTADVLTSIKCSSSSYQRHSKYKSVYPRQGHADPVHPRTILLTILDWVNDLQVALPARTDLIATCVIK